MESAKLFLERMSTPGSSDNLLLSSGYRISIFIHYVRIFLKGIFEQLIIGSIIKVYYITKCAEYAIGNVKTVHLILLIQQKHRELDAHNKSR